MTKKIRVLRLLEYTFDTVEIMEQHIARWSHRAPPGQGWSMKSVTLPLEVLKDPAVPPKVELHGTANDTGALGYVCLCGEVFATKGELIGHAANRSTDSDVE